MKTEVAACFCRSSRHFTFIIPTMTKSRKNERKNFFGRTFAFDDKIVARKAAHRPPIDNALLPQRVVAQKSCNKVLYCMQSSHIYGRLVVWSRHTDVKS